MEKKEETNSNYNFTLFGEPVIKTLCQRDAFMYGICGGVIAGLVGFLFTSSGRKATRTGVLTWIAITTGLACKCTYKELQMRREARLLKKIMYEMSAQPNTKDANSDDSLGKLESI
ncbi:Cytochrome c oxidase assembly protein COX20, mitochondrial [Anthophora plagiata]